MHLRSDILHFHTDIGPVMILFNITVLYEVLRLVIMLTNYEGLSTISKIMKERCSIYCLFATFWNRLCILYIFMRVLEYVLIFKEKISKKYQPLSSALDSIPLLQIG